MTVCSRLTVVLAVAAMVVIPAGPVAQTAGAPQTQQQQQRPVFRAGAHFVQVDAYPRRDGNLVEGLTAADFEVFEDGKPQKIDTLEFFRAELNTPEAERRDPNSQAEGNQLAADPRNRAFVLYLDHYHGSLAGSYYLRRPIVDMLNRMLAPNDLFAVATVFTSPRNLIFGRRTATLEDQLARHWTWGLKGNDFEPEENAMALCYGEAVASTYAARSREWRTLETLGLLTTHLGALREARTVVVMFSRGWTLYEPNQAALERILGPNEIGPRVGVGPGGRLGMNPPAGSGVADVNWCRQEITRTMTSDNRRKFIDLLEDARRHNVTFYPVNPDGLTGGRENVLRELAENTDGFTSFTNDLGALLRRITDAVSAYYVLGYYTANTDFDGKYRRIEVKVRQPGIDIRARRGYFAPAMPAAPAAGAGASKPAAPEGVASALSALSRLRPSADMFLHAAAGQADVWVVAELSNQLMSAGWSRGARIHATVTATDGTTSESTGELPAGQRSALVRVSRPSGAGPYRIGVRATSSAGEIRDDAELTTRADDLVGEAVLFRATPSLQSPLHAMATREYRRTERAHIEWPVLAPVDRREARLLSREGIVRPLPVTAAERERDGGRFVTADVNLAPLAAGDYVIELTIGDGERTELRFVALRVRN